MNGLYRMRLNKKSAENHHINQRLEAQKIVEGHHKVRRKKLHNVVVHVKVNGIINQLQIHNVGTLNHKCHDLAGSHGSNHLNLYLK